MTLNEEIMLIHNGIQKNISGELHCEYKKDTPPFLFTNENVKASFDHLDCRNKRVLTVASSGDHAFEAYTRGAKQVDVFDLNLFQKYVIELKHQMIKNLSYAEFMEYFFGPNRMDKNIYLKVAPKLSPQTNTFMNGYYMSRDKTGFFHPSPYWNSDRVHSNLTSYVSSSNNYDKLKKSLPNTINFTLCDLIDVPYKLQATYDIVHLSNVLTCNASHRHEILDYRYYKTKIIDKMSISENGCIVMNYLFGAIPNNPSLFGDIEYEIQDFKDLDSKKANFKTKVQRFDSSDKFFKKDAIFVLEKIKTR